MWGPDLVLAMVGPVAVAGTWIAVRSGRVRIWPAMGATVGILGLLSMATGRVRAGSTMGPVAAAGLGILAGVALYGGTAAFMNLTARRWPTLASQTANLYRERATISPAGAFIISALIVAPGEELLWRGVLLGALREAHGTSPLVPALAWALYVAVNGFAGSIPILLGGVVGGAAWTALAWWTGGVVAPVACHAGWTALMVLRPPVGARR